MFITPIQLMGIGEEKKDVVQKVAGQEGQQAVDINSNGKNGWT